MNQYGQFKKRADPQHVEGGVMRGGAGELQVMQDLCSMQRGLPFPRLKVKVLVTQSCLTLCDPVDCSSPDSSVHRILQARVLEWVAMPFSRGSSWPRDQTQVSCIAGRFSTIWTTREALYLRLLFFKCLRTTCANPSGGLFKMQIPSLQLISLESLRWGPEVFNLMKISSSSYASNTEEALQCRCLQNTEYLNKKQQGKFCSHKTLVWKQRGAWLWDRKQGDRIETWGSERGMCMERMDDRHEKTGST